MAGVKTNSNSITAILVNKLNYKKSGFRASILKQWNLPDDISFGDGTHCPSKIPEMNGNEVDIIGEAEGKTVLILEVKANLNESLQPSQEKGGAYEKTVNTYSNIKLKYIVPDGYRHLDELPEKSDKIEIITWSKIYEIAKENDNTGFTEQIEYFIQSQFHTNDLLLDKGDVAMPLSPTIIGQVESLYLKIDKLMEEFAKDGSSQIKKQKESNCHKDLGWWYDFKDREEPKSVWIGIGNVEKSKSSFFMCVWIPKDEKPKYEFNGEEDKDYFLEQQANGEDFYIPITEEDNGIPEFLYSETAGDQQKKFNRLIRDNISKLLKMLGKE